MKSAPARETLAATPPILREIDSLSTQMIGAMRTSIDCALRIGLRLLVIHREAGAADGGFSAALESLSAKAIPRSTAYRWINAASNCLARQQNIANDKGHYDAGELTIPTPGTPQWVEAEAALSTIAAGTSMRRLLIGSATVSDESRMDALITAAESGDHIADEILEKVAAGSLTLVQAIRAHGGASPTRSKERTDPVYLDIDGATGQPRGLFPRCLITLKNTFERWDHYDESARAEARKAWKALVSQLPKELR